MKLISTNSLKVCCIVAILNVPFNLSAATCSDIVSRFPNYQSDPSPLAVMINKYEENCKNRPNAKEAGAYDECLRAGFSALAVEGNYIAAERLTKLFCYNGHPELSKQWLNAVANSPLAPDNDKNIAQEGLNTILD